MRIRWKNRLILPLLIGASVIASGPFSATRAQDNSVTITLALPSFQAELFSDALVQQFESAHPNIKVQIVPKDAQIPPASSGLDAYLKAVQDYVSAADVLYVSSNFISPEATRAGEFLDLAPLAQVDKTLNTDDFYPAVWKSFQWDQGIWALPSGADATVLAYKASAFDAAGLAYPNDKWTIDDLANAMRKLAKKDPSGAVTVPSLFLAGRAARDALLQSLIGQSVFDPGTLDTLHFDSPAAEKVLDTSNQLDKEGLFADDMTTAPMALLPATFLSQAMIAVNISSANAQPATQPALQEKWVGVALPGGTTGLQTEGFGISSGTQHPNEAYALASYLTTRSDTIGEFSSSPARKSLAATLNTGQTGPGAVVKGNNNTAGATVMRLVPQLTPEIKAIVDQGLNNGLTISDLRYGGFLYAAQQNMKSHNVSAQAALQAAEAQANQIEQAAISAKDKTVVVVATPVPDVVAPGKIKLKFGILSNITPMPNQDQWKKAAQDFASSDPQVGLVDIQPSMQGDLAQIADKYDCFALPYNAVPGAQTANLLNLDPYLSADKTFDPGDIVGNVMTQLQQDNKTWAYPLMISPDVLTYDGDQFAKANVPEPKNGWTIAAFVDALEALKTANPKQAPFNAISPGGTHLLMLMAAYGGLPVDFHTNPPTAHFTDPATVDAIRQVLDLARNGDIQYDALSSLGGFMMFSNSGNSPAITTRIFGGPGTRVVINGVQPPDTRKIVPYPTGTQYNALSYTVETAYISAKAQNADACYRWISYIAQHPELFSAMPSRHSQINAQATIAMQGPDMVATYNQIDALLKDPKTIIFPSLFQGGASPAGFLTQHWLYEAFDKYVLHDGDLDSALKDAQTYVDAFQQCAASLPPIDASNTQNAEKFSKQYMDCAAKVDPRLENLAKGQG